MDDIVVENSLSADGIRRLHVMGNQPPVDGWLDYLPDGIEGDVKRMVEAGTHHLVVEWRAREMVDVGAACGVPSAAPMVMLWALDGGKATPQIVRAAEAYALMTGRDPQYAFVRSLPARAEEFAECQVGAASQVMLVLAPWVPTGFIAIR